MDISHLATCSVPSDRKGKVDIVGVLACLSVLKRKGKVELRVAMYSCPVLIFPRILCGKYGLLYTIW